MIYLLFFVLIVFNTEASSGGFLSFKQKYLYDSSVAANAQEGRVKFYSENKWSESIATRIEGRSEFTSTPLNLSHEIKRNDRSNLFDLYPGESFVRVKLASIVAQIGFQEIVWGESFGFNSADFITPKNLNFTFLDEANESRRPIPVVQIKHLGENYSLQLIYGAKPEFEKDYPLDLYFKPQFANEDIRINKTKVKWFDQNEGGAKGAFTFKGIDFAFFGYSYLDRRAVYEIQNYVPRDYLLVNEKHFRVQTIGSSFSTTLGDFVFRGDLIHHNGKFFNFINSSGLLRLRKLDEDIISLGFDTPSYDGYSMFFVASLSQLEEGLTNGFRNQNQNIVSLKIQKEMDTENKIEFMVFSELKDRNNGVQASYARAVNDQLEFMLGIESYFGDTSTSASRLKKYNSGFIKLKNHFSF